MPRATRTPSASPLATFTIEAITEDQMERVLVRAGGRRAHPDAHRRERRGADFVIGNTVVELKILEEEGLDSPERQRKLAELFRAQFPTKPTIVLDRNVLDDKGKRAFDNISESRIKKLVASAREQLPQSRAELGATTTVLWVINNGHSSLSHDALKDLAAKRARNDTREIDAVVVSGAYFYSDGFDSYFLWPMDCVPISLDKSFAEFDELHESWNGFANEQMTALMQTPVEPQDGKGPVVDLSFKHDGVTYVVPTPQMGKPSNFYARGRPRSNSTGIESCPPVATVFPGLSRDEWSECMRHSPGLLSSTTYEAWTAKEAKARRDCTLKPFIVTPITYEGWRDWATAKPGGTPISVYEYASDVFQRQIVDVMNRAKELTKLSVLPRRYMLLITEEIGQDLAFDVSHLAEVFTRPDGKDAYEEVWEDRSIFFEHALAVAAAEAIARGLDCVYWQKDLRYAWH
jgi:hypothetical protein